MKKEDINMLIFLLASVILTSILFAINYYSITYEESIYPPVELPEEYKAITKDDTLRGYFRNDSLIIEFNNKHNN